MRDHTLWLSNNLQNELAIVGWVNTKMFWETRDAGKSQGWTPLIVDTNGNGKRDAWVEPNQPEDPAKDKRIGLGFYGIAYSPRRRVHLGIEHRPPRLGHAASSPARIRRRPRWRKSTRSLPPASACADSTSTAMASRG